MKTNKTLDKEDRLEFSVYNTITHTCACEGILNNAIKHTPKYCFTENQAIKVEQRRREVSKNE